MLAPSSFLEIQLDPKIGYGTSGSLGHTTTVVTNPARKETRFPLQSRGYWKLAITFNTKGKNQMEAIHQHFDAVGGKAYGWRLRNYREYYTCTDDYASTSRVPTPEPITTYTSGTTLQLMHTRRPGTTNVQILPVRKPDMSVPIILYRDSPSSVYSSSNYTVDTTTGIVTFSTNQVGHTFYWSGYWDTPCRFDIDDGDIKWTDFNSFDWDGINVMEIQV